MTRAIAILAAIVLSACTPFPDLDDRLSDRARSADYPGLIPLESVESADNLPDSSLPDLQTRADRLRNRADDLRGDVVDSATRGRLEAAGSS